MNADHADACRLYATKLLGAPDGDWRCVGCDPEGLDLQFGRTALRLPFPQRVTAPARCARCSSSWRSRRAQAERSCPAFAPTCARLAIAKLCPMSQTALNEQVRERYHA